MPQSMCQLLACNFHNKTVPKKALCYKVIKANYDSAMMLERKLQNYPGEK